jgi:hypothetical protein
MSLPPDRPEGDSEIGPQLPGKPDSPLTVPAEAVQYGASTVPPGRPYIVQVDTSPTPMGTADVTAFYRNWWQGSTGRLDHVIAAAIDMYGARLVSEALRNQTTPATGTPFGDDVMAHDVFVEALTQLALKGTPLSYDKLAAFLVDEYGLTKTRSGKTTSGRTARHWADVHHLEWIALRREALAEAKKRRQ